MPDWTLKACAVAITLLLTSGAAVEVSARDGANPPPLSMSVIEGNFDFVRHFKKGEWTDGLELQFRHEQVPFDAILCNTDEYPGNYELRPRDRPSRPSGLPARSCDLLPNIDQLKLRGGDWTGTVWIRMR